MSSRFPLPDPAKVPAANRVAFESPGWGDMARQTAGLGEAFTPLLQLWQAFYTKGCLPAPIRQLVLSRTAYHCNCNYELSGERQACADAGLTGKRYIAVFDVVPSPEFTDAENVAAMIVDELVHKVKADQALIDRAQKLLGEDQVRELLLVIGMYMFYGRFIANLGVERV
jgi:alkylhydroperoxidase family enzyme